MNTTNIKLKNVFSAAALALLVTTGMPAVALASRGSNDTTTSSTSGSTTSGSSTSGGTSTSTETVAHIESGETMHTESNISEQSSSPTTPREDRAKAEVEVEGMRKDKKPQQTDEQRSKKCEDRKEGLQTKFDSIARNSLNYQTRIDDIYAKALVFQTENTLNPTGFAALKSAADVAKDKAAASVAKLQTAKPTVVDCTNKTVANDVATFKIAAGQARTDLKAYKQAVKAVIKSLRDANKTSTETQTETETPKTETPKTTTGVKQ